ncbi:DsbA family protein [Hankyongella ginsenosidimutans]|uniref:DsbA family protein n=1 Tax=Hankyongella ginsenosidimutans TaxID=1763828 RepID=UPI001CA36968|nr:thioredoxin domain-containing protein [Hankyongella ginsenosidimutans]
MPGEKDDLNTLNDIRKVAFETYKINGTPSFVINGESFDGQPTWPALKAKLLDLTK